MPVLVTEGTRTVRYAAGAAAVTAVLATGLPALANDSTGFMGTQGLELSKTDAIALLSEDLRVSLDEIRVNYAFRNETDLPVTSLVVFPFPPIDLSLGTSGPNWAFPQMDAAEFLNFRVAVDGRDVPTKLERRAFFKDRDVTDVLRAAGALDLVPWRGGTWPEQMAGMKPKAVADLAARGLVGEGEDGPTDPQWTLVLKASWSQLFPPGREVRVTHVYRPFVGGALIGKPAEVDGRTAVARLNGGVEDGDPAADRYCIDAGTHRALEALGRKYPDGQFMTSELAYILTTGANWRGPIGQFRMTIDKGDPGNILSLCWSGLRKTGPTSFEFRADNWVPDRDLALIVFSRGGE